MGALVSEARSPGPPPNFLRDIAIGDLRAGRHQRIVTRFPPEPNGYLHIGHAKSICLNFGLAQELGGICHLRMDDTNPLKEDPEYVAGIHRDVRWLGFDWGEREFAASSYFPQLYEWALQLVDAGKAYVDDLSEDEIRSFRGTVTEHGRPSPWRDRSPAENRDLLVRMRAGEFADGARVLRAKGDLASPNMKMRDPLIYRIRHIPHHAAGEWNIFPMYDYAHCLSDYIEGITHSFCTLEFENNRELYDWFIDLLDLPPPRPRQYEFARLNLAYTMMSKRRLLELVKQGVVSGWDDPRMPTLAGYRRRGVTPEAIRSFVEGVGVARAENLVDPSVLDGAIRDDLDSKAPRRMAVLRPLRVELTNWPADRTEIVQARDWPESTGRDGARPLSFGRTLWIDHDDFSLSPPPGWHRLAPGGEVRLRYGFVIRCDEVERRGDDVVGLKCSVDLATRGGINPLGRKVKGIVHWAPGDAPEVRVRLYDRLFDAERPDQEEAWLEKLNPRSLVEVQARVEPAVLSAAPGDRFQLERLGYFFADPIDSRPGAPVLNRIVALKDSFVPRKEAVRVVEEATVHVARGERSPEAQAWIARGAGSDEADVLAADGGARALVEFTVAAGASMAEASSWVVQEVRRVKRDLDWSSLPIDGRSLASLVALVRAKTLTTGVARQVLEAMAKEALDPAAYVAAHGLGVVADDDALAPIVDAVLAENADKAAQYRAGRTGLFGMFVGQVMKRTGGRADPQRVNALLADRLG
jgi:glutaminyl-tRNA synthetase